MGKLRRVASMRALHIASKHNISPNLFEVSLNMFLVGISAFYMDSWWGGEKDYLNVIFHIASVN